MKIEFRFLSHSKYDRGQISHTHKKNCFGLAEQHLGLISDQRLNLCP